MGKNFKFFLKVLEEIRLHWLFYAGFGEIKFSEWRDVYIQFKFLVLGNNKRVFRRFAFIQVNIFFLKSKRIITKKWYIMSPILDPAIHLHQIWHKLWEDSICGWPLEHTQTGIVFAYIIKTISYEHLSVCSVYISRLHGRKHKYAFCRVKHHWTWLLSDRYCSLGFFLAWNPLFIFRYTYSYKCWWQTLFRFWSVHIS